MPICFFAGLRVACKAKEPGLPIPKITEFFDPGLRILKFCFLS